MRKYFSLKKISIAIVLLLLLSQAIRIDKKNPDAVPENDFLLVTAAPAEVKNILQTCCYDCHSNTSVYPWYTHIAPVSWWIKHHINEGRQHLNFSEWAQYSPKKADHKLEECVEMVQEGEMPMSSYTLIHKNARLSEDQKLVLVNWFNSLRVSDGSEEDKEEHKD